MAEEPVLTAIEGMVVANEGDFIRAKALAEAALQPTQIRIHHHHLWHHVAAVFAMCGNPEKAVPLLHRCSERGLPNYLLFTSDPFLRALHDRPEFVELMATLRQEHE